MSKNESKAVSSQVSGLFDKIRNQAHEYSALMNTLAQQAEVTTQLEQRIEQEFHQLKKATAQAIKNMESMAADTVRSLEHKAASITHLYGELDSIVQIKNNLTENNESLITKKKEIDSLIQTSGATLNKLTEEAFLALEKKLAVPIQKIKEDLISHEQKISSLYGLHRREVSLLQDEMDGFKKKVTETKYIVEETTKIIENMINEAQEAIDFKLHKSQKQIETMFEEVSVPENASEDSTRLITTLQNENTTLKKRFEQTEKKVSQLQLIALISAASAVILSLLLGVLL